MELRVPSSLKLRLNERLFHALTISEIDERDAVVLGLISQLVRVFKHKPVFVKSLVTKVFN